MHPDKAARGFHIRQGIVRAKPCAVLRVPLAQDFHVAVEHIVFFALKNTNTPPKGQLNKGFVCRILAGGEDNLSKEPGILNPVNEVIQYGSSAQGEHYFASQP
jgi:hypothetical protein